MSPETTDTPLSDPHRKWSDRSHLIFLFRNNPKDISIVRKLEGYIKRESLRPIHDRILPQKLFGIESDFIEKNRKSVCEWRPNTNIDYSHQVKLYANDKAGKAGRTKWFVAEKEVIKVNPEYIDYWKVVVSSANAGGQKRDNQLEIIDNHSAFGRSRVALGAFKTKAEAQNFYKYVNSYIARYAFLMTDEALTTLGMKVPDIGDYSSNNKYLNFSEDIDTQLAKLVGLTDEELEYVKLRIDNLRKKEMV